MIPCAARARAHDRQPAQGSRRSGGVAGGARQDRCQRPTGGAQRPGSARPPRAAAARHPRGQHGRGRGAQGAGQRLPLSLLPRAAEGDECASPADILISPAGYVSEPGCAPREGEGEAARPIGLRTGEPKVRVLPRVCASARRAQGSPSSHWLPGLCRCWLRRGPYYALCSVARTPIRARCEP